MKLQTILALALIAVTGVSAASVPDLGTSSAFTSPQSPMPSTCYKVEELVVSPRKKSNITIRLRLGKNQKAPNIQFFLKDMTEGSVQLLSTPQPNYGMVFANKVKLSVALPAGLSQ